MEKEICDKLYRACYMRVYSYLVTLTHNEGLAEELAQNTFYKAFTSKASFRSESDSFTWLCAIAKNLFLDEMRKNSKNGELSDELPSEENIEQKVADRDMSLRIHIILHSLAEPYREVFELRVFGELSFSEIGTVFGKSENWARVTYHRAKIMISERLGNN